MVRLAKGFDDGDSVVGAFSYTRGDSGHEVVRNVVIRAHDSCVNSYLKDLLVGALLSPPREPSIRVALIVRMESGARVPPG